MNKWGEHPISFCGKKRDSGTVSTLLSVSELIRRTFLKPEIAYLIERPRFRAALAATRQTEDFDDLRNLSREWLRQKPALLSVRVIASQQIRPPNLVGQTQVASASNWTVTFDSSR